MSGLGPALRGSLHFPRSREFSFHPVTAGVTCPVTPAVTRAELTLVEGATLSSRAAQGRGLMEKSPVDADETGAGEKSRSYGSIEVRVDHGSASVACVRGALRRSS
jgi:hypothetical protein